MDEQRFTARFGRLLGALDGGRSGCPDADRLVAFAGGEMAPAEGAEVAAHLARCTDCAREVELLGAPPAHVDEVTWRRVERGLEGRDAPWKARPGRRVGRWMGAAAAALAAAAGLSLWLAGPRQEGPVSSTRGSAIQVVGPAGEVRQIARFEWTAPPVAATFRVEVRQGEQRVWAAETVETSLAAPADLAAVLRPGLPYRWRVEALAADGRAFLHSEWTEVRLAP